VLRGRSAGRLSKLEASARRDAKSNSEGRLTPLICAPAAVDFCGAPSPASAPSSRHLLAEAHGVGAAEVTDKSALNDHLHGIGVLRIVGVGQQVRFAQVLIAWAARAAAHFGQRDLAVAFAYGAGRKRPLAPEYEGRHRRRGWISQQPLKQPHRHLL
jgi:hypothetical protein